MIEVDIHLYTLDITDRLGDSFAAFMKRKKNKCINSRNRFNTSYKGSPHRNIKGLP